MATTTPPSSPARAAFARATRRPSSQKSITSPSHSKHQPGGDALRKVSFKHYELEEWADLFFHRPLAHRLIQLILALRLHDLGLNPNHITLCSLLAGWGAASWMAEALIGDVLPAWYIQPVVAIGGGPVAVHLVASVLMLLSISLDCADGQLARALGVSSPMGRFYDGLADTLVIARHVSPIER